MKWKTISDYKTVDFYGSAPSGSLLYAKRVSGSYTSRRVLYCNLPTVIGDLNITAMHLLRLPGLSADNAQAYGGYAYFVYELYEDVLDLASIDTSSNPDGTGASNYHRFLDSNRFLTALSYEYIDLNGLSLTGDKARSMRLYLDIPGSDGEYQLDAPGGIQMSEAAIGYTW